MMATSASYVTRGRYGFPMKWVLVPGNNAVFLGKFKTAPWPAPHGREWALSARTLVSGASRVIGVLEDPPSPAKPVQGAKADQISPSYQAKKRSPATG